MVLILADKKLDPLNAYVSERTEFLKKYFNTSKCEFSSVNIARSALSLILPCSNGNIGKYSLIEKLLKGMFKLSLHYVVIPLPML